MITFKYPSDWQDYSGLEGTSEKLDTWVYNQFSEFISNMTKPENKLLAKEIVESKGILFFHLCGMDIAGHSYKPKTK